MEKITNEVVNNVTTVKKKYVKPDFEVINIEDTPKLLAGSGGVANPSGKATFGNNGSLEDAIFGN